MKLACLQLCTGEALETGLEALQQEVMKAKDADIVFTPEMSLQLFANRDQTLANAPLLDAPDVMDRLGHIARDAQIWLSVGSICFRLPHADPERPCCVNRSLLFDPEGRCCAHYDKIHLFDVDLGNERHFESRTYQRGDQARVVTVGGIRIGLTICYDLRFPHLFQALAEMGAEIIAVPAAFTVPTGQAHWQHLLQARAIETGCTIVAAAQGGVHASGRTTWGHSMIIAPDGCIVAQAAKTPDCLKYEIFHSNTDQIRPQETSDAI